MKIIKNREVIDDTWISITANQTVPAGDVIVPVNTWLTQREGLAHRQGKLGVLLNSNDDLDFIIPDLIYFDLVALNFPKYTDGRNFSLARLLRDRYNYEGEIRAVGNILRDQLAFLERCGFDAFTLTDYYDPEKSITSFDDISVKYQTAADRVEPAYRYR